MRTIIAAAILIIVALPVAAAENQFPLTLHVLGLSETSHEYKRLWSDQCIHVGMGAPCAGYEQLPPPGWAIDVLTVTGRVTQRGRTVEYQLECRTASMKRPCAPMKYGNYPARWNGKRLEVQVTDGKGKGTVNRFEIKGEHDADEN